MIPIRYNVRSLAVRKATTLATALGIALVVFVLASSLMLSAGIHKTLGSSGKVDNAIVLRMGSDAELGSVIEESSVPLILGNTIAMGVRERTSEYGVLRAIGFLPSHVAIWVVGESLVLGALGGLLGVGLAWPFVNLVIGRFIEENMGSFFPYFRLVPENMILAIALSALLGGAAAVLPAWRASQLRVVDAVRRVA